MSTFTRLDDYVLVAPLAQDPFGSLHRAVKLEGGLYARHALVRRFNQDWHGSVFEEGLHDSRRTSIWLGEARGIAPRCRIYDREDPWISYAYLPGQTLAALQRSTRTCQLPLGLEHVLTILRDLAQILGRLHELGLEHGMLNPHQVWVTYDGAVMLLDATIASAERKALEGMATVPRGLEGLQRAPGGGYQRDLFLLGTMGWALLTQETSLPADGSALRAVLNAWAERAEHVLPEPLVHLLARMMGLEPGFPSLEAFLEEADAVLHEEEQYSSTFSLAFLMHTLFREEIAMEGRMLEAERDFLPVASGRVVPPAPPVAAPPVKAQRPGRPLVWLGLTAGLVGTGVWTFQAQRQWRRESLQLNATLADTQRRAAELAQAAASPHAVPIAGPKGPDPSLEPSPAAPEKPKAPAPSAPGVQVALRVFIDPVGHPLKALVQDPARHPASVNDAAIAAALAKTYPPVLRNGRPGREWIEVSLSVP